MNDVTDPKGSPLKVMKVTAASTAAVVLLTLQLTILSAFLDFVTSLLLIGGGFMAGRASK